MSFFREIFEGTITKIKYRKLNRFARSSYVSADTYLEGRHFFDKHSRVVHSYLGYGSYVGHDSEIESCRIGKYTCIGPRVHICHGNHPAHRFVSIHPAFYSLKKQIGITYVQKQKLDEETYADKDKKYFVEIGNDVWIGSDVKILAGVSIGNGAIIAAGAVVTKSVEPYTIVAGVPARNIRRRFNEEQSNFLQQIEWWNKGEDWIESHSDLFVDVDLFMEEYKL